MKDCKGRECELGKECFKLLPDSEVCTCGFVNPLVARVRELEAECRQLSQVPIKWNEGCYQEGLKAGEQERAITAARVQELEAELVTYKYDATGRIKELEAELEVYENEQGVLLEISKERDQLRAANECMREALIGGSKIGGVFWRENALAESAALLAGTQTKEK